MSPVVPPIRVLVADDHAVVRDGLVRLLADSGSCEVVAEAADGLEAVQKALETRPQVVVTDLSMPRLGGLEAVRRIHEELPQAAILVLTMHGDEEYVVPAVQAGASGYLLKDSAGVELIEAVETLARGEGYFGPRPARVLAEQARHPERSPEDPYGSLTPREREVFHLVVEGATTKEVAKALGISVKTAENHRGRASTKLGAKNTAELVAYAARKGLLS